MKPQKPILNSHIFLYTILAASILFTGCQNSASEKHQESEHNATLQDETPDLNVFCENLKTEMQSMNNQRTTLALEQLNQSIRLCLPLINFPEQQKLIRLSGQMYNNFLKVERTPSQQQAFETYTIDKSEYPTLQQQNFEKLNIRDQYLLRHQGQAYIEVVDLGSNKFTYRRNPQYLAKIFAPYLPDAESICILELAEQDIQPSIKNHRLSITPQELARRTSFWKEYQHDFPNSVYCKNANALAQNYAALSLKYQQDPPIMYSDSNVINNLNPTTTL